MKNWTIRQYLQWSKPLFKYSFHLPPSDRRITARSSTSGGKWWDHRWVHRWYTRWRPRIKWFVCNYTFKRISLCHKVSFIFKVWKKPSSLFNLLLLKYLLKYVVHNVRPEGDDTTRCCEFGVALICTPELDVLPLVPPDLPPAIDPFKSVMEEV